MPENSPPSGSSPPTRGTQSPWGAHAGAARLIPAHAGNTCGRSTLDKGPAAHPRPRGEHKAHSLNTPSTNGSSPPTRGTPPGPPGGAPPRRLIPAHAGNTRGAGALRRASPAHPRPRGEHRTQTWSRSPAAGSSPPTRGTPGGGQRALALRRLIPAHAGNTRVQPRQRLQVPAHPRPRGEHNQPGSSSKSPDGSSPPTRGTRRCGARCRRRRRLIPAHAGNTCGPPRRREARVGSSPPTRGTRLLEKVRHTGGRLIPAHAGNTTSTSRCTSPATAHPRPRGEHGWSFASRSAMSGSSPPTRGTQDRVAHRGGGGRLIPAHAGNTRTRWRRCSRPSAHPRPRGEHPPTDEEEKANPGSSPPTRGTRYRKRKRTPGRRLIPAHAGNTACPATRRRCVPAHPRPRGEHTNPGGHGHEFFGSSPPTRGTRAPCRRWGRWWRLIPAHAGNT